MLCWSCGKELPQGATRCSYCEADMISLPSEKEMHAARDILQHMDPNTISELQELFAASKNGEEFVNKIMVGDCPACGSSSTGNCEHDPDVEDLTIGRCFDCGVLWCTICGTEYDLEDGECVVCQMGEEEDFEDDGLWDDDDSDEQLDRYHLLAAEIFGYSFANYRNHLGIGNIRFEKLMPDDAKMLERAVLENWPLKRVADAIGESEEVAAGWLKSCRKALQVVDAPNAGESFRAGVRRSIEHAVAEGLNDADAIEDLVTQICYRVSDFSVLLEMEGLPLQAYSDQLRSEPDDIDDLQNVDSDDQQDEDDDAVDNDAVDNDR